MVVPEPDSRDARRRELDEQISLEPELPPPDLDANAVPMPMEVHLPSRGQPIAVAGIVENGMVRPLDPAVKLPERSRVIIVTAAS